VSDVAVYGIVASVYAAALVHEMWDCEYLCGIWLNSVLFFYSIFCGAFMYNPFLAK
jgi:hypothetical protein